MPMPPGIRVDCSDIEGTSCYCAPAARAEIIRRIAPLPLHAVHFLDSGDYHYVSRLWTQRIGVPYALVLLDHHPDLQPPLFPGMMSCGGWVREVLEEDPWCRKALLVGVDPDLSAEAAPFPGRVRVLDASHTGASDLEAALDSLGEDLPVFLSIDKDILSWEWARTDWSQGTMSLAHLGGLLRRLASRCKVIGADICGELPLAKGGTRPDWERNAATNAELLSILTEILRESDDFIVSLFNSDNKTNQ